MTNSEIYDELEQLSKLLTERIEEMHKVQGMQQCRHAYIYYRSFVYRSMFALRDNLNANQNKPIKKK
jgi:hypothetical protein